MIDHLDMLEQAGTAIAPSIISASSAIAGVIVTAMVGGIVRWRDRVHERNNRWNLVLRENYAEAFAALDELSDAQWDEDCLDGEADDYASQLESCRSRRLAAGARINRALATIDLLAPQNVCDRATEAYAAADKSLDDADRVRAMEAFVTATRRHLGIQPPEWKQKI